MAIIKCLPDFVSEFTKNTVM